MSNAAFVQSLTTYQQSTFFSQMLNDFSSLFGGQATAATAPTSNHPVYQSATVANSPDVLTQIAQNQTNASAYNESVTSSLIGLAGQANANNQALFASQAIAGTAAQNSLNASVAQFANQSLQSNTGLAQKVTKTMGGLKTKSGVTPIQNSSYFNSGYNFYYGQVL